MKYLLRAFFTANACGKEQKSEDWFKMSLEVQISRVMTFAPITSWLFLRTRLALSLRYSSLLINERFKIIQGCLLSQHCSSYICQCTETGFRSVLLLKVLFGWFQDVWVPKRRNVRHLIKYFSTIVRFTFQVLALEFHFVGFRNKLGSLFF